MATTQLRKKYEDDKRIGVVWDGLKDGNEMLG
jgi:hypothetical protein